MDHRRSTPREELAFLVMFVVLFAATLTILNRVLLPHNYSKTAVLLLASILVGIATIFLRYFLFFRKRGRE